MYGLKQAGKLSNYLLSTRLYKHRYYQCATTPGLWRHKWRPVIFVLIVDNFGIQYTGCLHASIYSMPSKNSTKSLQIGKGKSSQVLTLDGIIPNTPAGSQWTAKSPKSASNLVTKTSPNHSTHRTNIAPSPTAPRLSW
jgi:hypothetical protein